MFARALIVLLVVLNLGAALWWALHDPPADAPDVALPQGVARLQLAGEVMPQEMPAPAGEEDDGAAEDAADASSAATATPAAPAEVCASLGPFASGAAAGAARGALASWITRARLRETAQATRGWRVAMPPLPDRAAAEAMAGRLRQAGFHDLYVMTGGDEANSIALGRFSTEAAARSHAARLQAAGFEVRVSAIGGEAQYWLDVALAAGTAVDDARRASGAMRAEALDCDRLR